MNDLYKKMMNKCSKDELIERISRLEEIEIKDREFAHYCFCSMALLEINDLFDEIGNMKDNFSKENAEKVYEKSFKALAHWKYITSKLCEMDNAWRVAKCDKN